VQVLFVSFQLFQQSFVPLYGDKYSFGIATRKLIGSLTVQSSCVIIQSNYEAIEFLEGVWNSSSMEFINRTFEISSDSTDKQIFLTLQSMQERGCKLIISDCDSKLMIKLTNVSKDFMNYPHNGFVWLLTQNVRAEDNVFLPDGLLLVERNEEHKELRSVITRAVISVNTAAQQIFHILGTFSSKLEFKEYIFE